MNIFEESLAVLKSKTKLRTLFKSVHIEDVENVLSRVQAVLEEKKEEVEQQAAALQEKQEQLQTIIQLMKDHNISLEELNDSLAGKSTTRKRRDVQRMTFRYETNEGNEIIWEGSNAGRIPADFAAYLERTGKKRLDCVVE
ncbi:DNA-binding protein H-NS [Elysia marginata]|uniref:DNA-binding protein H-NS n=1 Tax=Elysia marginata TaxID=1093978 RepID=A0AAV4JWI5_9GAST|nr:DNA-binding protein H-NS [Elysia marginata]